MKKTAVILLGIIFLGVLPSYAQLSSKEKKALQKQMMKKVKEMDPEDLEEMYNEYPSMKGKLASCEKKSEKAEADAQEATGKTSSLESKITELEGQLEEARSAATSTSSGGADGGSSGGGTVSMKGLVYKVQIGAFKNKDLSKYFDNNKNFGGEIDKDGTQKYTIGVFKEYWEADAFKKYMREMGVKDAWIVAYRDGNRISMKEAREG